MTTTTNQNSEGAGFSDGTEEKDVASLALSPRALNALRRAGFNKIGDLMVATEAELLRSKGFGSNALQQVAVALSKMGLCIGWAYRKKDCLAQDLALATNLDLDHFKIWTEGNIPEPILNYIQANDSRAHMRQQQPRWAASAPPGVFPGSRLRELEKQSDSHSAWRLLQGSTLYAGFGLSSRANPVDSGLTLSVTPEIVFEALSRDFPRGAHRTDLDTYFEGVVEGDLGVRPARAAVVQSITEALVALIHDGSVYLDHHGLIYASGKGASSASFNNLEVAPLSASRRLPPPPHGKLTLKYIYGVLRDFFPTGVDQSVFLDRLASLMISKNSGKGAKARLARRLYRVVAKLIGEGAVSVNTFRGTSRIYVLDRVRGATTPEPPRLPGMDILLSKKYLAAKMAEDRSLGEDGRDRLLAARLEFVHEARTRGWDDEQMAEALGLGVKAMRALGRV